MEDVNSTAAHTLLLHKLFQISAGHSAIIVDEIIYARFQEIGILDENGIMQTNEMKLISPAFWI